MTSLYNVFPGHPRAWILEVMQHFKYQMGSIGDSSIPAWAHLPLATCSICSRYRLFRITTVTCVYVCLYMYIYVYVHMYTHISQIKPHAMRISSTHSSFGIWTFNNMEIIEPVLIRYSLALMRKHSLQP